MATATTGTPVSRDADAGRVRRRRRGQHEHRVGAVAGADPAQPAQHLGHVRAEHPPVGVALVDHDEAQRPEERRPARWPGSIPRWSMSGLVSTTSACARTQSRSSRGVSPSKVAARTPARFSARTERSWSPASALVGERYSVVARGGAASTEESTGSQ